MVSSVLPPNIKVCRFVTGKLSRTNSMIRSDARNINNNFTETKYGDETSNQLPDSSEQIYLQPQLTGTSSREVWA
ncbi:hypothetical protein VZT92_000033 [Zoarces viviparus]|uniref:Uncharacterized protein n=1 Tax=Zoarces viviparus TaxID=48416 RepID=A0AAW1G6G0_ZOAVI